jgi:light-harvesting complex 1 beta chain
VEPCRAGDVRERPSWPKLSEAILAEEKVYMSGLTDSEAKELHEIYMKGFTLFTGVAVVAHILVWLWRPWIPGADGYAALENATTVLSMIS